MSPTRQMETSDIVERVRAWPLEDRVGLAAEILSIGQGGRTPRKRTPLKNLLGLLKTDEPLPDDETIQRMLDERRMQKFSG